MKRVVVASHNPVKREAALNGFERMFPAEQFELETVSVSSGVSDQPFSSHETYQGAYNRARNAANQVRNADYWVGIEGGVELEDGALGAFAWVVVIGIDRVGKARTGTFFLPPALAELVQQGVELGEADDMLFKRTNSKQGNGAIGLLTDDVIDRVELYEPAVIFALIPFKKENLYPA